MIEGLPPYHILTFQIWFIILFLIVSSLARQFSYQFVLLNVGASHSGDIYWNEKNFILHPPIIILSFFLIP